MAKHPCFISSQLTLLMSVELYGAAMSWLLGMIVAVVAVGGVDSLLLRHPKKGRRDFSRRVNF